MSTIGATQICIPHATIRLPQPKKFNIRKSSTVCFCEANNGSESDSSSLSEGDKRKQEILARIANLQAQKVRLTDFLDERSAYLTQFAEDASTEFDQIGEGALKELDEASARIMDNLESQIQAFEESAEVNRREIEKNAKELEEFEDKVEKDRNEGLFFKNLSQKKEPEKQRQAKEEAQKVMELTKASTGSGTRKSVYLVLMTLLGIVIANSVISSAEVEWKRIVALMLIFLALLAQYVYELKLSSEIEKIDKKK